MHQSQHDQSIHPLKDQDLEDQDQIQEEEKIEEETWEKYVSYLNRNNLNKRQQHFHEPANRTKDPYPKRIIAYINALELKLDLKQIPSISFYPTLKKIFENKRNLLQQINSESQNDKKKPITNISVLPHKELYESHIKNIKTAFLAFLRDIAEITWDVKESDELIRLTIIMLRLLEETVYIIEDENMFQLLLMIFNQLAIKDDTLALLLNSLPLQDLIYQSIQLFYLEQIKYSQFSELSLQLLISLVTYYEFTNETRINTDLMKLLVACYKRFDDQNKKTKQLENDIKKKKEDEKKGGKKKLMEITDQQEQKAEDLYMQVPIQMQEYLASAMATLPPKVCDMKTNDKFHLIFRNNKIDNYFNQVLSAKVLQSITSDPRQQFYFHIVFLKLEVQ